MNDLNKSIEQSENDYWKDEIEFPPATARNRRFDEVNHSCDCLWQTGQTG